MTRKRHLFTAIGIELEYMIVRKDDLKVLPISEHLLKNKDGTIGSEIEHGKIAWSNELIMHLIELKTNGPARSLD
ncbi:glutamate--cysteine ligase, partial [Candidatus Woesearchaeota archaeon CG08_land_8_20_14_0_20_43_7]